MRNRISRDRERKEKLIGKRIIIFKLAIEVVRQERGSGVVGLLA